MTYGCLLDDNVLDEEVLELKVFRVRVRLGILQGCLTLTNLLRPCVHTQAYHMLLPAYRFQEASTRNTDFNTMEYLNGSKIY